MPTRPARPRCRDLGIQIGLLEPGPLNAITDVPGVRVGHTTLVSGSGPLAPGQGPVRTGVTAILPHAGDLFLEKVVAAIDTINGFGEVTNIPQVDELGVLEGPILLTNTLNVALVADAAIEWSLMRHPAMGVTTWGLSPVVAECSDAYLNDIRGRHVRREHVFAAIDGAGDGPVAEGAVGAGTGMTCFGFKGGIGTASRRASAESGGYLVGVLVLTNFGERRQLRINGVPVGWELRDWEGEPPQEEAETQNGSSFIAVVATDAPLSSRQLGRIARRVAFGLARTGSFGGTTSGDFAIAFSTANRRQHFPASLTFTQEQLEDIPAINGLFQATVEATEEAILNSLFKAETVVGRDNHVRYALPLDRVIAIMRRYGYPLEVG